MIIPPIIKCLIVTQPIKIKLVFMVIIMDTHNTKERDRFWDAYRGCAEENRVRPDRSPFYVRWAKEFESFLRDKPLKERSRKDIEAFLSDLRKRQGIADWQVRQAEHALRILYEIFLPRYAPERQADVMAHGKLPAQETITRKVSCHIMRHSGVYPAKGGTTHLLEACYDIRTVQELLGHADVATTMIYAHVLNRPVLSVKSPVDI